MDSNFNDFECAICLQMMVEPVRLPVCKHLFCLHCIQGLDDFAVDSFKCPMCRTKYSTNMDIQIDTQLQKQIELKNPDTFQQRLKSVILEEQQILSEAKIRIIYGNKHEEINPAGNSQNKHRWTMTVDVERKGQAAHLLTGAGDLIKSVKYHLHPTFNPPTVTVNQAPFALSRIGWGTFRIDLTITFQDKFNLQPLKLYHDLSFEDDGHFNAHIMQLNGL